MKAKPVPWNDQNYAAFAASAAVKDEVALGDDTKIFSGGAANVSLPHDTTAPTILSTLGVDQVFADATGLVITVHFTEIIQDYSGFSLVNTDTSEVVTLKHLDNLGVVDTLRFQPSRAILAGENFTLIYTPGTVRDNANNFLVIKDINDGTDSPVINNSTATTTTTTT